MRGRVTSAFPLIAGVALAVTTVAAFLLVSSEGLGVGQRDAIEYGATARSLVAGDGFVFPFGEPGLGIDFTTPVSPLRHYPPGYPLALAMAGLIGADPFGWSRVLQGLLLAINAIVAGFIVWRRGGRAMGLSVAAGAIILLGGVQFHARVSSEPLFVLFELSVLGAVGAYFETRRGRWLYVAALAASAAFAMRYVGAAAVAVVVLAVLWFPNRSPARRAFDALGVSIVGISPMAAWVAFTTSSQGAVADRTLAFHPFGLPDVKILVNAMSEWFLPSVVPIWPRLLGVMGLVVALAVWAARRRERGLVRRVAVAVRSDALSSAVVAFVVIYAVGVVLSISLLDAQTRPNSRIIYPVFVAAIVAMAAAAGRTNGHTRTSAAVVAGFMLLTALWQAVGTLVNLESGTGFNSPEWRDSFLIAAVAESPSSAPVFSNAPDAVYYLTGRSTWSIPARVDPFSQRPNSSVNHELEEMAARIDERQGMVAIFDGMSRPYLVDLRSLEAAGLELVGRYPEGMLLKSTNRFWAP